MGHLQDSHKVRLIRVVPVGTCKECATKHPVDQPHNCQSLAYQYKFFDVHGRFPTWSDAMVHCSDEVKQFWIEELAKRGVTVEGA